VVPCNEAKGRPRRGPGPYRGRHIEKGRTHPANQVAKRIQSRHSVHYLYRFCVRGWNSFAHPSSKIPPSRVEAHRTGKTATRPFITAHWGHHTPRFDNIRGCGGEIEFV